MSSVFLALALLGAPVQAAESSPVLSENSAHLVAAFDEICLRNRGSWKAMNTAAQGSALGFIRVRGRGDQQADFVAGSMAVSLKRAGESYLCLVQGLVPEETSTAALAERVKAEGFGLADVNIGPDNFGMHGIFPQSGRSSRVGTLYTELHIRLAKKPPPGTQIAQLLITN